MPKNPEDHVIYFHPYWPRWQPHHIMGCPNCHCSSIKRQPESLEHSPCAVEKCEECGYIWACVWPERIQEFFERCFAAWGV